MRASVAVEKLGLPTASLVCQGFVTQGNSIAAALGLRNLPMSAYPGQLSLENTEDIAKAVKSTLADQVIKSLTVQPKDTRLPDEPTSKDTVFTGSFEEVNRYFYAQEWSEGLPIVPPTREKVAEFLKFTDRSPDEVITLLLPDRREATIWNIAINGVMAGCRPEYMPVLVAIVKAMADPKFGHEHLGHTPGTETLITINGPIIKELDFNYEQGALRVGFQANTSIGRFWRLYLRNVAGFLPHKTDKGTFGGTFRVVLAENEAVLAKIGWESMSVEQGFAAGENVVTVNSCTSTDSVFTVGNPNPEIILDKLAARIVDIQLYLMILTLLGPSVRPQILMSPSLAEALAKAGYTKKKMRKYLYEHATFPARRFEELFPARESFCELVEQGRLPKLYCASKDPERRVPVVWSPEDFMFTVSGDPGRDNCFICGQNGFIGYPVSHKIELPENWAKLLPEAKKK